MRVKTMVKTLHCIFEPLPLRQKHLPCALQTDTEQWFFSQSISSHHLCKNIFASICFSAESPLAYETWHTNISSRCLSVSAYKICGQDKYLHFDFLWFWADVGWCRCAVTRYNVGVNTGHASLGLNCSAEACNRTRGGGRKGRMQSFPILISMYCQTVNTQVV